MKNSLIYIEHIQYDGTTASQKAIEALLDEECPKRGDDELIIGLWTGSATIGIGDSIGIIGEKSIFIINRDDAHQLKPIITTKPTDNNTTLTDIQMKSTSNEFYPEIKTIL